MAALRRYRRALTSLLLVMTSNKNMATHRYPINHFFSTHRARCVGPSETES
jgi:hypothetical protein